MKFICKATLALHNFLMKMETSTDNYTYCPVDFVDREDKAVKIPGQWRSEATDIQGLVPVMSQGSNNFTRNVKIVRDDFKLYFNSRDGAVEWQRDHVESASNPFDEVCNSKFKTIFSLVIKNILLSHFM